jgi:hypothetical protein
MTDELIGLTGEMTVHSRGAEGPGEVRVLLRGMPELFIAHSAEPIARGARVLVYDVRGKRTVSVEPAPWADVASLPSS